ncbi:MAG TPA: lysylphosphatidylglycerol synthase domain-containing protein [Stellaceae bacterium]|nr:lysylphosphatidylglycerol synthase domain-containing protein [Stellaceae bacterium]
MRLLALALGLLGLAAASGLVIYEGAGEVLATFASVGWGLPAIALFHVAPMAANARAWRVLLPGARQPRFGFFLWIVWVREGVNAMLPVFRVGGEVVGARLMMMRGIRTRPAVASLVVDMTMSLLSQFLFTMIGLFLLFLRYEDTTLCADAALGLALAIPILGAFAIAQRLGLFGLFARLLRPFFSAGFERMVGGSAALDRAVRGIYRRPRRALVCLLWQLAAWLASSGEIWIALKCFGHPLGVLDAVIITAVIEAASSSAFLIPGALGVQEGSFLVIGSLLGLTQEEALALALVRRARDVLVYGPALALWQLREGRRLISLRAA